MKIKNILKNKWVRGVGVFIIGSYIVDIISGLQIFSWIGKQIKFFFTFSLPFKLWFCVLIVLLLISVILLLFFIKKKFRLILNSDSRKVPERKVPNYVKKYTEQVFGKVLYKWNWIPISNEIFPYEPNKIKIFCPKCNCELVQIQMASEYQCPVKNCNRIYGVEEMNRVKALIRYEVENNLWREAPKKKIPRA